MPTKFSYIYVKDYIEERGFKLYSSTYENNATKLKLGCSKDHIFYMRFGVFRGRSQCPKCFPKHKYERHNFQSVKDYIEKHNHIMISKEYIDCHTKIEIQCPKGHIFKMRFDCFKLGQRCSTCSGNRKRLFKEIKEYIESFDYQCLTEEKDFKNTRNTKLKLICPKGHDWETVTENFYSGSRCAKCANEQLSITFTGSGNPQWRGGISFGDYCPIFENRDFKQSIKDRDGNKCLNPYCFKNNKNLVVHHIDYNKKNCDQYNLITICNSCNSRANIERKWHTMWYKTIIYKRYLDRRIQ